MSTVIDSLERQQLRRVPAFQAGDRVRVHFQVVEGSRRRTQVFEGVVIKRQGEGVRETFTVRKNSFGVGVERTFPVHSPKIERIEVAARGDVRRAKLYYLRGRVGKRARVRERRYIGPEEVVEAGLLHDPAAEAAAAADEEVPGEAVDQQALDEAEAAPPEEPCSGGRGDRRGRGLGRGRGSRSGRNRRLGRRCAVRRSGRSGRGRRVEVGARGGEDVVGVGLAARARTHRRRRARSGARHPGVPRQAVPHPERVDGPDARDRPARAREPDRRPLRRARGRRRRRLPSALRRRAGQRVRGRPAAAGPGLRPADRRQGRRELHQARRGRSRRPPAGSRTGT